MKKYIRPILEIAIPLLVIVIFTIISSFVYLYQGIATGDDFSFHCGNVYDVYYGLTHGLSIDSTNHVLMGIYGYNTHLFYAPLAHYFAAISMIIFHIGTIEAIKFTVSFFSFIGALSFYLFAKKVSKNIAVSLIATAFFVFCPYRAFCSYCRFAIAETVAISLIPVLFYGIYSITHDEKPRYFSFLMVVLGISGLVLTHPFTALMSAIIALIYMAVKYKQVWGFLKDKKGLILTASTVLLIFMLIGFYFFPMMMAKNTGLYRISDPIATWTNYKHVSDSTANSWHFSGFLNLDWISGRYGDGKWPTLDTPSKMVLGGVLLLVGAIIVAIIDHFFPRFIKNKYLVGGIAVTTSILPLLFFVQRIEIYLALVVFDVVYFVSKHFNVEVENKEENKEQGWLKIHKETFIDVIFLVATSILLLVLIFIDQSWYLMPEIFYSSQFAWRLWSVMSMNAAWLFLILVNTLCQYKNKIAFIAVSVAPALLFAFAQSYPEKRVAITYPNAKGNIYQKFDMEEAVKRGNIGVMNEYIPIIFYDNTYQSEYTNSLYSRIKLTIGKANQYVHTAENYIEPAFLTGDGTMTCKELNSPNVIFNATINEDSLVQIPQFYYDGYVISLCDTSGKHISNAKVLNVDSLVSFNISQGEYIIKVTYKGPAVRQAFNVVFYFGLSGVIALSVLGIREYILEKRRKEAPLENNE